MHTTLLIVLLAGCGTRTPASDTPVDVAATRERSPEPAADALEDDAPADAPEAAGDAPEAAAAIAALLGARHADDLPTREVLDHHPEPDVALAWLARSGDSAAIRTRALALLGLYPERDHAAVLIAHAAADQHPSLRAAALTGFASYAPADREAAREVVVAGLQDANVKVALAAVRAAEGVPGFEADLQRAASEHPDARVREAAAQ